MTATVFQTKRLDWNSYHNRPNFQVLATDAAIPTGLVARLVRYAAQRVRDLGFGPLLDDGDHHWRVEAFDADQRPSDRTYCVRLVRSKGGQLCLQGILTKNGWPTLDHGFDIQE